MKTANFLFLALAVTTFSACGSEDKGDTTSSSAANSSQASNSSKAGNSGNIVISVTNASQNPKEKCWGKVSIANETGQSIGAFGVMMEWRNKDGDVLQKAHEYGAFVDEFDAGKVEHNPSHTSGVFDTTCDQIELVVTTYACRDADTVWMQCPGKVSAGEGATLVNTSQAAEGNMAGFMLGKN